MFVHELRLQQILLWRPPCVVGGEGGKTAGITELLDGGALLDGGRHVVVGECSECMAIDECMVGKAERRSSSKNGQK